MPPEPRDPPSSSSSSSPSASAAPPGAPGARPKRGRLRDLGLVIGSYKTGKHNAITDVEGVRVGHATIISDREGTVRTGVTAVLPHAGNVYNDRVAAGAFILNGAGEVAGLTQVVEWGLMETPILLTNTLSVGSCSEAVVKYLVAENPSIGKTDDVVIPLVGECDDSWLNDIAGNHVRVEHVYDAINGASTGPVHEGSVGGGTGMVSCDFKGGIGTSSRKLHEKDGGFTLGVLVMTNFGHMRDLRMGGVPVGEILAPAYETIRHRVANYGSIIAIAATDAPLLPHQLNRLAKRVALGIGRVGSYAAHGSGEIVLAFSTANTIPRQTRKMVYRMKILLDSRMDPLYRAVIEATEEAILNALCAADDMVGVGGHFVPGLPLDEVREILARYAVLRAPPEKGGTAKAPSSKRPPG